jgi:hypothetical protein
MHTSCLFIAIRVAPGYTSSSCIVGNSSMRIGGPTLQVCSHREKDSNGSSNNSNRHQDGGDHTAFTGSFSQACLHLACAELKCSRPKLERLEGHSCIVEGGGSSLRNPGSKTLGICNANGVLHFNRDAKEWSLRTSMSGY